MGNTVRRGPITWVSTWACACVCLPQLCRRAGLSCRHTCAEGLRRPVLVVPGPLHPL